jgi:hypothetical protein
MSIIGSELLLGAAGAGGGYEIERSLRFNSADSAYLNRTPGSAGNRKTWTLSFWVKRGAPTGSDIGIFSTYSGSNPATACYFNSNDGITFYNYSGSYQFQLITTQVFRDYSAWYHFVFSVDTTQVTSSNRVKIYVNGNQITTFSTATYPSQNIDTDWNSTTEHQIGNHASYLTGYLADIHFIDGQALDPSSFGEFDDNGVWQPIEYSGTYGTNGFHLPFSDNSTAAALGTDTSGNGNTWTVNNLSVNNSLQIYSSGASYLGNAILYSGSPAGMFGGGTGWGVTFNASSSASLSNGGKITFPTPLTTVTSIIANVRTPNFYTATIFVNDNSSGINIPQNQADVDIDITAALTGSSTPTTFSSITWGPTTWNGYLRINYLVVNGVQLTESTFNYQNDSLVDSPTNYGVDTGAGGEVRGNYCTWNPLRNVIYPATTSNGNLELQVASGYLTGAGSISVSTGKWYWEMTLLQRDTITPNYQWTGVVRSDNYTAAAERIFTGTNTAGVQYWGDTGNLNDTQTYGATFTTSDVIGAAFDVDAGSITFYKNGVSQGASTFNLVAGASYYPSAGGGVNFKWAANFGQRPFAYTAPSGFKALCTTNLPEPTIADGSTAMDVKLYTGNGSTQTISGLNFSPDLVWLKSRSSGYGSNLVDTVRGATNRLVSNATEAEATVTNGLTAFTSDGFSLGSYTETNVNTGSMVAWTWDAGSSTVTNTEGSISSQVRANPGAGFSIVTYTGTGSALSFGHGLGVSPGLVIIKQRSADQYWAVGHSYDWTKILYLNTTDSAGGGTTAWSSAPSSTVINIGTSGYVNVNTGTFVAYCFAPVAGYSSFGSYTGNGLRRWAVCLYRI